MGRFFIENNKIIDNENNISSIDIDDISINQLTDILNELELDKLKYKRDLNTLKHRIKRLVE